MHLRSVIAAIAAVILSLPASAAITGTVINADGQAVTGAKISLFSPETAEARRARLQSKDIERAPLASTTSDSKGNFSIATPKGEAVFDVRLDAAGFAPDGERALPDEELGAILLMPAALQKGTITANGKPVAGAVISFVGSAEYLTKTDDKGQYAAPDPSKWANRLFIIHSDYAIVEENLVQFGAAKKSLDRTLLPGLPLRGRVLGSDGTAPVANAPVFVDEWQLATTGEDGSFSIAHAPKGWSVVEARSGDRVGSRARTTGDLAIKLQKAASITGIVTDGKTNAPLAGVEVRLMPQPAPAFGSIALHSTFTNAKGGYTLTPIAPGSYQINPTRPGYLTPNVNVTVTAGQTVQKLLFSNARGRVIGSVVDDAKRPVAGARLGAQPATMRDSMVMMVGPNIRFAGEGVAYSGPDGRFVMRSVPTESDIQINATKKGFPAAHSASLRVAPLERKSGVLITIPRGVAITGKVTDRDGKPLSGVGVTAVETDNQGPMGGMAIRRVAVSMMQNDRNDEIVRTGSDGTFTMRVKEATYDVIFKREGFAARTIRGEKITASARPLEVTLDPGVEIAGRVVRNGAGIEGVNINVFSESNTANAVTASDGSFRLEDLTPGQVMLAANKRDEFIQEMRPVTAPAQNVVIEVRPGGKISGRVVDKNSHAPITSFQAGVSMSRSGGGMVIQVPPMLKPFTSDDGSFTLENVPVGPAQVVVSAPGYSTARVPGLNIEEGKPINDLEVALDTGVKLTGRVTGPDGSPVAGVNVRQNEAGPARMLGMGSEPATITDPNGEYILDALEPGEKTFSFGRQGYLSESRTVTLSGSSTRLDVQLSTGMRVNGTVVSDGGGPVADAMVYASSAANSGFGGNSSRTDAGGNFQLENLAPGHYTLTARKDGYGNGILRDFDVAAGMPARIIMKSGATVMGHVTGLTAEELQNTVVNVMSPNGNASSAVDSAGNYKVEGAPSGTVRVSARTGQMFGPTGRTAPQKSVQVEPGGTATVDLEFKSTTVVRGRVTRDGQPMANAAVMFYPRGAQASTSASTQSDNSGNYEVSGLDDATYNVQVMDFQRTMPFSTSYEVKGSGTFDIDIRSSSLRGRVVDATTGEPLANARIELRAAGGDPIMSSRAAVSGMDGTFVIDAVARGTYEAKADHEGYGHQMKSVVVGDTAEDLEFKLSPSAGVTITVVDARDNRPLSATAVRVVDAQGQQVDAGPRFFFGGGPQPIKLTLAPGTYRVTIAAMNYATRTVSVVSPSNPTVRLSPGGTLAIRSKAGAMMRARLVDANGAPYLRSFSMGDGVFTIDASPGVTTLQNIAAGSYRLEILGTGNQAAKSIPVTVIDGQVTPVEVD